MPLASADDDGELFADGESGGKGSSSSSDEVEFDFDDQPTPLPAYQPTPAAPCLSIRAASFLTCVA